MRRLRASPGHMGPRRGAPGRAAPHAVLVRSRAAGGARDLVHPDLRGPQPPQGAGEGPGGRVMGPREAITMTGGTRVAMDQAP